MARIVWVFIILGLLSFSIDAVASHSRSVNLGLAQINDDEVRIFEILVRLRH